LAPPLCSAFARTVARTAVAAEFAATSARAVTAAAGTAAELTATPAAALTAVGTFAAGFAARRVGTGGGHEDSLGGDAEQGGELALQRGPEADGGLDRDDDGLDLNARTIFATRAIFTTRAITFGARTTVAFGARATIAFGARFAGFAAGATFTFGAGFATRAVTLRDAGLAAFFGETFRTRLAGLTGLAGFAAGATFTFGAGFAARTVLAGRSGGLGAVTREVLGQLRRIFDDADGGPGGLTVSGGRSGATRRATAAELLRSRDGAWFGGGFGRGPDHGERREFRVGGLQLGFVKAGRGGADFIGACVRGGLVGGDWLLALGFFLAHVAYVGAAFVVADRMMRPFRCGAATRFVGPLVTEDEPPWGAEMTRERLPEHL
jgi:hypothetical protein